MTSSFSVQSYEGKRIRFDSARSYEEVLASLRELVNTDALQQAGRLGLQANPQNLEKVFGPTPTEESFTDLFRSMLGEQRDFILFYEIDHGAWLPAFGIRRRATRWIFGNPLIAITMLRHDIRAGLFAPVELLLFEPDSGNGSTVIYDLPSSLMVVDDSPELLSAALVLDAKLQDVVSRATGVQVEVRQGS